MNTKMKRIVMMALVVVFAVAMMAIPALAATPGDVSGAIKETWDAAKLQVQSVVNNVVFPVIDMILAIMFFIKLGTAYLIIESTVNSSLLRRVFYLRACYLR